MANPQATVVPQFEDLDLYTEWVHEAGHDTLIAYLPGFRKEQLKVQLTSTGRLRLTGERQVSDNRWSRFRKEFLIPPNCDANQVSANFKGGMLHVKLPKLVAPADSAQNKQKPTTAPPTTSNPLQEKGKPASTTGAFAAQPTTATANQTQKNNILYTPEPKPAALKPVPEKTERPMKPPATEPQKQPEKVTENEKIAKEEKTMDPEKAPKKEEKPNFVEGESSKKRAGLKIDPARTKVIGRKISEQTKVIGSKISDVSVVYKEAVGDIVTNLTTDQKKLMAAMAVVLVAAAIGYVTKRAFESSQ